ncbi:MAG TPA: sulfite oxidase-like oxidoreductase [Myxococcota bacterium]|nr:sulfite oxidase-like oxidoreductase [Myxococcota bacterium]
MRAAGRLPPSQHLTEKWPVLHYGTVPSVDLARWDFRVFGLVQDEVRVSWRELRALPAATVVSDIHCVTHWSKFDCRWEGVPVASLLSRARPKPGARFALVHAEQGFTANLPLADLLDPSVLLAWSMNGEPLAPEHGAPLRLVVPKLYFWKSVKWVRGIELLERDQPGFWERNGYHMRGDPWREERYSDG